MLEYAFIMMYIFGAFYTTFCNNEQTIINTEDKTNEEKAAEWNSQKERKRRYKRRRNRLLKRHSL